MTKERYLWYKKEIERLKQLDTQITNRVRATYHLRKCDCLSCQENPTTTWK